MGFVVVKSAELAWLARRLGRERELEAIFGRETRSSRWLRGGEGDPRRRPARGSGCALPKFPRLPARRSSACVPPSVSCRRAAAPRPTSNCGRRWRSIGASVRRGTCARARRCWRRQPEPLIQTGSPVASPRPCRALSGFPRTTISQPRGSKIRPYSPGAKSAYVLPRRALGRAGGRFDFELRAVGETGCSEVFLAHVQLDVPEPIELDDDGAELAVVRLRSGQLQLRERTRVDRRAHLLERHAGGEMSRRRTEDVARAERRRHRLDDDVG